MFKMMEKGQDWPEGWTSNALSMDLLQFGRKRCRSSRIPANILLKRP